jgi:acylpyruvate hydrolase
LWVVLNFVWSSLVFEGDFVVRFVSFRHNNNPPALGIRQGEQITYLNSAADADPKTDRLFELLNAAPGSLMDAAAQATESKSHKTVVYSDVKLCPLIRRPGKVICLGLNYAEHAKEGGFQVPDYPAIFLRASTSLIGAKEPIILPLCSETLDYEAELAVVIGRRGRYIQEEEALGYVAGYSIFNDASVREYQRRTSQWTMGKNFDGTGAFGPELVTPDELPPGADGLRIQTRLNDRVVQDANTRDMIVGVARTIALVSEVMTLEPADVIITGTPPGVGHARTPPLWLRDGDVCEVEIEGIGILDNPVLAEKRR